MDGCLDAAGFVFDGRFGALAIGIVSVTYTVVRLTQTTCSAETNYRSSAIDCYLPGKSSPCSNNVTDRFLD
jgi:hypothetical protein